MTSREEYKSDNDSRTAKRGRRAANLETKEKKATGLPQKKVAARGLVDGEWRVRGKADAEKNTGQECLDASASLPIEGASWRVSGCVSAYGGRVLV